MAILPENGGGIIKRKITYAAIALCVIFSALPFASAAEVQNTYVNQSVSTNVSGTNAVTDQDLRKEGLEKGSTGTHVVQLQKWLKNQGYYVGAIDGSFGPYTKEAVKLFQDDANIVVDGWVANQTINAMEKVTGEGIFTETDNSKVSSNVKSTKTETNKVKTSTTNATTSKKANVKTETTKKSSTKVSTAKTTSTTKKVSTASTTKKTVSAKTSVTSSSSLSQILASGARYGYSHSASTAAGMMNIGSGDCWAMSDYLYSKLQAAGIKSRIVQYSTAYSSRHRSVQIYQNGAWVDVPYSSYGFSTMFKATSSKPGLKVIAS